MDLSRYDAVVHQMAAAAESVGREPAEVTLIAVSKGQPIQAIRALYEAGQRDFGENRAQEMADKSAELPADIRWHFVGSLQSNKVRVIRERTHLLHSLDRLSLASAWIKGLGHPPDALLQVNIGREEQKGGVLPEDLIGLATNVELLGIKVIGLMAIPPIGKTPEDSRRYFSALRKLRDENIARFPTMEGLSMGMTDDFETGIHEGASFIRVGRAIFGERH